MFTSNTRIKKVCDFGDFNHGMVVGTRGAGLRIPEIDDPQ